MNVLLGIEGLKRVPAGAVLTIGNFDGVHRGHAQLLRTMHELRSPGTSLAVVTFEPHPLTVLRPQLAPPRLTSSTLKQRLLDESGVDHYVVLPPTHDVLDLSAEKFWQILRDEVKPAHLIEGNNFTFGKARGGNITRLREWSKESAIQLHIVPPVEVVLLDLTVAPVSSSLIRYLIAFGRVRDAAICLGRPYALEGEVIEGYKRGRTIGVPTANLNCADQFIPADGVYAGKVSVDGAIYPAAVSIGTTPTFEGARHQIEAHLLGYSGNLYGRTLHLQLMDWIRDQRKFAGLDALKSQLQRDFLAVHQIASSDCGRQIATHNA